jgi:hypothetical protein
VLFKITLKIVFTSSSACPFASALDNNFQNLHIIFPILYPLFYLPHVATVCLSISQTMIKWGFFYLYYSQYQPIFLVIENFRSILEAQAWITLGKS